MIRDKQSDFAPYTVLKEPTLEFGIADPSAVEHTDPQQGLMKFGPYSQRLGARWHPQEVRLFPVAPADDFDRVTDRLRQLDEFERIDEPSPYARVDFPGFSSAFRSGFQVMADSRGQTVPMEEVNSALAEGSAAAGYRAIVSAYEHAVNHCGRLASNEIVVLYLPPPVVLRFHSFTPDFKPIKRKQPRKNHDPRQMLLFADLEEPDEESHEETLFHDLRRSLKVVGMRKQIAIQVITDSFLNEDESQPWAGKFWNTATSIFCKAGGVPWRIPTSENVAHCGIKFGISREPTGQSVLVGVAQVFSAGGEFVALRAGRASRSRAKTEAGYFMTREQSRSLMRDALDDYLAVTGRLPDRLVVHKSSPFKTDEADGVEEGCAGVGELDMLYLRSSASVRLLPARGQPADRCSVVPSSDHSAIVYTSGYIPAEGTWRGRHVPRPVEIVRCRSRRSLLDHARELLCLTKMNWNTTIFSTRDPCTFTNATEIIGMMKELGPDDRLAPHIRYYI